MGKNLLPGLLPSLLPKKILIVIRHAHRDTAFGRERDNGISPKGKTQAKRLQKYFKSFDFYGHKPILISSPAKRCIETLEPMARALKLKIQPNPYLSEGGNLEEKSHLFLRWWSEQTPPVTIMCSHGDWIPVFLKITTGATIELEKAGFAEVHKIGNNMHLFWVIQIPMLKKHTVVML